LRKVVLQMFVSVDGYVAGPDRDMSWIFPSINDELRHWINDSLSGIDTQLLGRVSYQEQEGYWPTATEKLAPLMNNSTKIVFGKSPGRLTWSNSRMAEAGPAEEIAQLRQRPGGDIYVPGGAGFVQSLTEQHLIDEYRLITNPVALGSGLPLFTKPINFHLVETQSFYTGAVAHVYERRDGES
jgi:dihydrofolate reductase